VALLGTSPEPVQSRGLESAPDGRAPAVSDPESTRRGNYEHLRLQPAAREVRDMSAGPSRRSPWILQPLATVQRERRKDDTADAR